MSENKHDTDKLRGMVERVADFVELLADRLKDGVQWLTDGPAVAGFFIQKETRTVINNFEEARAEAGELKPSEIAELVETGAKEAKEKLQARGL